MARTVTDEQRDVCNRIGADCFGLDTSLKVGIALESLDQIPIHAVRLKEENGTTGWYIWGGEYSNDLDFYSPLCAAHLPKYLPSVLKYLALPPGYRFIIDHKGYEDIWFDSELIT